MKNREILGYTLTVGNGFDVNKIKYRFITFNDIIHDVDLVVGTLKRPPNPLERKLLVGSHKNEIGELMHYIGQFHNVKPKNIVGVSQQPLYNKEHLL